MGPRHTLAARAIIKMILAVQDCAGDFEEVFSISLCGTLCLRPTVLVPKDREVRKQYPAPAQQT